jgi:hypothetical protein
MPTACSRAALLAVLFLLGPATAGQQPTPAQQELEEARRRIAAEQEHLRSQRVAFGEPLAVSLYLGPTARSEAQMEIRPLLLRGSIERFVTGQPHPLDERYFVVRTAYRVEDVAPEDPSGLRWQWARGGWVQVDRRSGRVRDLSLPDFDPYYSEAAWHGDYAAYCGLNKDADEVLAVVARAGSRRPVLRVRLGEASGLEAPDSECTQPRWWGTPDGETRVTFVPRDKSELTYGIHGDTAEFIMRSAPAAEARR